MNDLALTALKIAVTMMQPRPGVGWRTEVLQSGELEWLAASHRGLASSPELFDMDLPAGIGAETFIARARQLEAEAAHGTPRIVSLWGLELMGLAQFFGEQSAKFLAIRDKKAALLCDARRQLFFDEASIAQPDFVEQHAKTEADARRAAGQVH